MKKIHMQSISFEHTHRKAAKSGERGGKEKENNTLAEHYRIQLYEASNYLYI